ncbi:MAG: molybdenum cofactor biosynthesis protein MoaE [Pseudomonadota bacterium]
MGAPFTDIEIAAAPFDPEAAHADFRRRVDGAGAIVAFTGLVRGKTGDGEDVSRLTLQHYPGFTEKEITRIVSKASVRWPLVGSRIIHRTGDLESGEPIVFVATASIHRRAAFEAADFLMDYLKADAPFWKKETRGDNAMWIEPRAEDLIDKARWRDSEGDANARDQRDS